MNQNNYTTTITVDQSPEEAFTAINNIRKWWSENVIGDTDKLGVFFYHYKETHLVTFEVTELIPGKKVVWHVLQNYFSFTNDQTEWTGNDIIFDISKNGNKTEIRFTQVGLVPSYECYNVCQDAWGTYIQHSLYDWISTGKGDPTLKDQKDRSLEQTTLENHPNA